MHLPPVVCARSQFCNVHCSQRGRWNYAAILPNPNPALQLKRLWQKRTRPRHCLPWWQRRKINLTILSTSGTSGAFDTRVPHEERRKNPLTTEELEAQRHFCEHRTQREEKGERAVSRRPTTTQPQVQSRWFIGMSWKNSELSNLPSWHHNLHQKVGPTSSWRDTPWGSRLDYGESTQSLLGTAVEEADQEIGKILLWMQKIPGESATKPAAWKPATRTNGWERTI